MIWEGMSENRSLIRPALVRIRNADRAKKACIKKWQLRDRPVF
jgi:hypothetical protein